MDRFEVVTERSTVMVSARSSMGPIVFEAQEVTGSVEAVVREGSLRTDPSPRAAIEVDLRSLRSDNELYDAELLRRIDAQRHPVCGVTLDRVEHLAGDRYGLTGHMRLHGVDRAIDGTVAVTTQEPDRLVVVGEKTVDVRDFDLPAPSVLLLKIYPEVRVQLLCEALRTEADT